ncbi:MAG: spore coat associated protein CotJA [Erysipelotrichales bacterium]|nr:spore coat associated protein CotJA [Erysipelotrichales bacterium]
MYSSCDGIQGMPLAMGYVPKQEFKDVYPIDVGFFKATIFKELDKPFERGNCRV